MVAQHTWNNCTDWEYTTLTGCSIFNDSIVLDYSISEYADDTDSDNTQFVGTILSDIKDSTYRIKNYDEIIPVVEIPDGTSAEFFIRTGIYKDYTVDTWSDWIQVAGTSSVIELTLSLNNSKIITDYDIHDLSDILYTTDPIFMQLARIRWYRWYWY